MGIHNREYMRDEPVFGLGVGWLRDISITLVAVNVAVFLLQVLLTRPASPEEQMAYGVRAMPILDDWFALDPRAVWRGQVWRLTTYDFLHSSQSIWHLFWNMWLLVLAGRRVEQRLGSKEYLTFFLSAGAFAGVFYLLWGLWRGHENPVIGSSGAVSALLIFYALNWPHEQWKIFGIIPVPVMLIAIIVAALDLFPLLRELGGNPMGGNVAHAAHVGGMLFAVAYQKGGWRLSSLFSGWSGAASRWSRKRKLKLHHPPREASRPEPVPSRSPVPRDVEDRLDQLLEKISLEGEKSLTAEERKFLADASRRFRNRS